MLTAIKVYTKLLLALAFVGYCLLFVVFNTGQTVGFWWWFGRQQQVSSLILALTCFVAGVLAAVLWKMIWRSLQQLGQLRERSRAARLESDLAKIRARQVARGELPSPAASPTASGQIR